MSPYHSTLRPDEVFAPDNKQVKMDVSIPSVCPKCGNPNANISGSVFGTELSYKISCMSCGFTFSRLTRPNLP